MGFFYSHENLDAAVRRLKEGVLLTGIEFAVFLQAELRADAPWQDRNGPSMTGKNARESLEAEAGLMDGGEIVQIVARSDRQTLTPWKEWAGAPVGAFLELGTRYMRKREVIKPTVQRTAPELHARLALMMKGDL